MKSTASAPTTLPLLKLRHALTVLIRHLQLERSLSPSLLPPAYRQLSLIAPTTTAPPVSRKLIPLMCINSLIGKQLPIYGDGQNVCWLYVETICALDVVINQSQGNL